MNPEFSPSFASPKSDSWYFKDMNFQKEEMVNVAKKIIENINWMSFVSLGDEQVHSILRIREIARGIVDDNVEEVTKDDVDSAISCSIDKMVISCRDVDGMLSRLNPGVFENGDSQSVSRMKEIVSTVVASKRAKLAISRSHNLGEVVDAIPVESKVCLAMVVANDTSSTDIREIQKRLFSDEVVLLGIEDGQNENQGNTIGWPMCSEIGQSSGEAEAPDRVQSGQVEGTMFEDVEMVVEGVLSIDNGENELQETFTVASEQKNENVTKETVTPCVQTSIVWPEGGEVTLDWVKDLMTTLDQATKDVPPSDFLSVVPISVVDKLIVAASNILSVEPNCVEVDCRGEDSRAVVVGDIHGQFHDLLNIFELAGFPSENQFYVFNGDYVDRGAWGLEVFLVLLAWKVLMPKRVYLLRGNHETKFCTSVYGFETEIKIKFGDLGEMVYKKCLECFKELPLASVISGCAYTTHGGLFRSMDVGPLRRSKRKRVHKLKLGSLEDLSKVNRYLIDVADEEPSILTDTLWSDPSKKRGLLENVDRGLGLFWGPDCTEMFLKKSKLKLIIRSHQGPDARVNQDDFGDIMFGYSTDHIGKSGKLYTLFSAPSYPQFGETFNNEGAYAILKHPNFDNPSFHSFKAVERPKVDLYIVDDNQDGSDITENNTKSISMTSDSSASQANHPAWMSSTADFEALGISNPPSWSVTLTDKTGGTKLVQVPRAPSVEGLPLPLILHSNLQESHHKAAFEYLLELVAGLKHMLSTRASFSI